MHHVVASATVAIDSGLVENAALAVLEGADGVALGTSLLKTLAYFITTPVFPPAEIFLEIAIRGDDVHLGINHRNSEGDNIEELFPQKGFQIFRRFYFPSRFQDNIQSKGTLRQIRVLTQDRQNDVILLFSTSVAPDLNAGWDDGPLSFMAGCTARKIHFLQFRCFLSMTADAQPVHGINVANCGVILHGYRGSLSH